MRVRLSHGTPFLAVQYEHHTRTSRRGLAQTQIAKVIGRTATIFEAPVVQRTGPRPPKPTISVRLRVGAPDFVNLSFNRTGPRFPKPTIWVRVPVGSPEFGWWVASGPTRPHSEDSVGRTRLRHPKVSVRLWLELADTSGSNPDGIDPP